MLISPFTPLNFVQHKRDGIDGRYIQTFAPTDKILIEAICSRSEPIGRWQLMAEPDHIPVGDIEPSIWKINDDTELRFITLVPAPGLYSIVVADKQSNIFRVTDDPLILESTTLIQYSMNSNRHRTDTVFYIDGMQRFFEFRAPGGFKDSNWSFSVEGEQFITDRSDIVQLSGLESTQKKFTLGNSEGCPVWFADLLNRLLCCTYVYFNGERYARKGNAAPELTALLEGVNGFVFTQSLQRVAHIDPAVELSHQILMRNIGGKDYRLSQTNINRTT